MLVKELTSATGMGWFLGYAIDLTTGERLNMAYGEDSWLETIGNDMMWNPLDQFIVSLEIILVLENILSMSSEIVKMKILV